MSKKQRSERPYRKGSAAQSGAQGTSGARTAQKAEAMEKAAAEALSGAEALPADTARASEQALEAAALARAFAGDAPEMPAAEAVPEKVFAGDAPEMPAAEAVPEKIFAGDAPEPAAEAVSEQVFAGDAPEMPAAQAEPEPIPAGADDAPPEPARQPDPEADRRLAELTRTVQVSVEQILARMESEPPAEQPPAAPDGEDEEDEKPEGLGIRILKGLLRGLWGIVKWLLLVTVCVALVTGASVGWLYHNATEEMLPQITATFAGQVLEPTAYDWRVPVVADLITRRYEFNAETPQSIDEPLAGGKIQVSVSPTSYETRLTIRNADDTEIFSGSVPEYGQRVLPDSGIYHAQLVVSNTHERFSGTAEALGSQTYDFTFEVSVRPSVHLDREIVKQGDVLAVTLTGTQADDLPVLECELESAGFVPASNGWVAYLPIAWNQHPGTYNVRVRTKDHVQDLSFTVRARDDWDVIDHASRSQMITPYLGPDDAPAEVKSVLGIYDDTIYWAADGGFVAPYTRSPTLRLEYGATEYVGRSAAQIKENSGSGRTAVNTVVGGRRGETIVAPAAGRVLLAAELEGTGGTVVIEHGGGVKSVLYRLDSLDVQAGDMVTQGQQLGTANSHYIIEARVGDVQVDPLNIFCNQCNAMRCY